MKVVIADDQALVRGGFRLILRAAGMEVAAEAADGAQAVTAVLKHRPDVALRDIRMPELDGIEATRRILAAHPDVVVFLCSTYDVADLPPAAANSGAAAYVNKEQFGADMLRRLWAERSSGSFAVS
jgi:DNA-binding NarL/FixJ family response regulator